MKAKITIGLITLVFPFLIQGQTYNQYFDGADTSVLNSLFIKIDTSSGNIWQIGQPQKTIFDNAATLPNAIVTDISNYYPINNTSSFSIDLPSHFFSWGIYAIQWKQKLDMDRDFDGGIVEFSSDSGNTWQNAFNNPYVYNFYGFDATNKDTLINGDYAFSGTDTTWKNIWLCFDYSWITSIDNLSFRYTLKSDSVNNNKEGWMIDNLISHITLIHTVNEVKEEEYMKVGPNPTSGRIDISTKKLDEFHIIEKIELTNNQGEIVQTWGISPTKFYVDISHHPTGIYFLKIKTNKSLETFKIVLKH